MAGGVNFNADRRQHVTMYWSIAALKIYALLFPYLGKAYLARQR